MTAPPVAPPHAARLAVEVFEHPGAETDLVLLHGWAMHGGIFGTLIGRLKPYYRIHCVDLPGHGLNRDCDVPMGLDACAEAIAQVVPAGAVWCGWSLGGLIALHAAHTGVPMQRLVMLCASPCFVKQDDWRYGVSAEIFRDFAHGLRTDWHATLDRFIALEAFGSDHAREELRTLRDQVLARGAPNPSVLADGLDLLKQSDLRSVLPGLSLPTTWIAGRRDRLVDPRAMQEATALCTHADVHVIEHAGHAPFLTHGDAVVAALRGTAV